MQPLELFELAKRHWPAVIPSSAEALNEIYWPLDDQFFDDDWLHIAIWSFHQTVWLYAQQARMRGEEQFPISAIALERFDIQVRDNLSEDSWQEMRRAYGAI